MVEELLHDKIAAISHALRRERWEKVINSYEQNVHTVSDQRVTGERPDGNSDLAEPPLISVATFSAQSSLRQKSRIVCVSKMLQVRIVTITELYPFLKSQA